MLYHHPFRLQFKLYTRFPTISTTKTRFAIDQVQSNCTGAMVFHSTLSILDKNLIMSAIPQESDQATYSKEYPASSIGSLAKERIQGHIKGTIRGVTSRGIFIQTHSRFLFFISFGHHPGPLTINVPPAARKAALELVPGEQVDISSGTLYLNGDHLVIATRGLSPWQPRIKSSSAFPASERINRLTSAAGIVTGKTEFNGLSCVLPFLLPALEQKKPEQLPHGYKNMLNLVQELNDIQSTAPIIELLGSGSGLTPSGDDVIIGLLLAINRWQNITAVRGNLDHFNQQIISAAYQKTTTLSANLIDCASRGLADRRLVDALDWLVSETGNDVRVIDELLTWGSSSGADAFVGFAAALSPGSKS